MAKLIFKYDEDSDFSQRNREASEIQLTVPDKLTIWELKTVVKRLAASMGFTEGSIERCFGENDKSHQDTIKNIERSLLLGHIDEISKQG